MMSVKYICLPVVWDISNEKTLKREERALFKAMEEFNLNKGLY